MNLDKTNAKTNSILNKIKEATDQELEMIDSYVFLGHAITLPGEKSNCP